MEFYCCDDLIDDLQMGNYTLKEAQEMWANLRYCPYCGHKLSSLQ